MQTVARERQESETSRELRLRVRDGISDSGIPQREVARRVGMEETKLSKSLRGTRRFTPDELIGIATVAGVTVNWLMTGSDSADGPSAAPDPAILPGRIADTPDRVQKRLEILDAAWHLFGERGLRGTSIAEIAARCGVSSSAVHYHFASKRELFAECLRYSVKRAFDRQVASLEPGEGHAERLKHLVELQLPTGAELTTEWSIWLQSWSAVVVGALSEEDHAQAYGRWYRTVRDVLEEGRSAGAFAFPSLDDVTMILTALIDGLGVKVLVGLISADEMRDQVHRCIDRTIVAHAPPD
ncbi:TetR family transcriptional regulator [Leucobacter sp. Psy1]|nr:TetR family transcriptional regulator [Leucobacter sp. Psy1]